MTKQEDKIPVLYRDTETSWTDKCPYCKKRHVHGSGDGHREAHCSGKYNNDDGYITITKTNKKPN